MTRVFLIAAAALALTACDYEEVEREIGYKGKARVNPWLAAERFTERMDYDVRSVASWTAPQVDDAVWVVPASILNNESFATRMEKWVEEGGHLILLVEKTSSAADDWKGNYGPPVLEPALFAFLKRVGLELDEDDEAKADEITFDGDVFEVDAVSDSSIAVKKGDAGVFASVPRGNGRVTVLTDARIFRNRWIDEHDHAALLGALVDAGDYEGSVGFMRGSGLSLWSLLGRYLWPVLIALGVWLLFWLWKNFTRFGPVESATAPSVLRSYEHHLEALGDFQWRLDRCTALLTPLREQIVESGQRLGHQTGRRDEDFFQFLAERADLPRERVFRALAEIAPADPAILTRTTSDLQKLLKALNHRSMP